MNIRHECPMPDLSLSVTAPLHLHKANGCRIEVQRWSLAGIWVTNAETDLVGDVILSVPFQGVEISFPIWLAAGESDGHYRFENLTVRQRETLATFHQGVLSGQMVSTPEMITSLDTPVDLVPMGETDAEQSAGRAAAKPRWLRMVWNILFYTGLAAVLVGFLGAQIWQRLSRIELEHARFTAPVIEYMAPDTGFVAQLNATVGEDVSAGDILVRIEDPDRESDVEEVRAEVMLAERRLRAAEERRTRHLTLRETRRAVLWEAFKQVWKPWRFEDPHASNYPPELEEAWFALYEFDHGRDTEAGGYFDMLAVLDAAVEDRRLDLRRWKRELRHRKAAADKLVIRAHADGTVFAVHTARGSFTQRGAVVVELEERTPRTAAAWLDDSMATRVYLGMPALITYTHRGQVSEANGTVTDIQAGTDVARPDRFGMVLTIKADNAGVLNTRKWFRRNAPAQISLQRRPFWHRGADEST
ncbi:HlyD family efflux transporter periplasmic adaptor subunit [uncultured Roseobacter sp.]|uniref:HlyD family efflux transporter periplasmic adaptor subunit n=1 Tax=uncultured Roseobacter sp. TaxID=114847 RepID=UPI002607027B|nr:HlyD family secretion protein [uncultured Roseobacter sp.]